MHYLVGINRKESIMLNSIGTIFAKLINILWHFGAFISFIVMAPIVIVFALLEKVACKINKSNYYAGHNKFILGLMYVDATIGLAWITTLDDATDGNFYEIFPDVIDNLRNDRKRLIAHIKHK